MELFPKFPASYPKLVKKTIRLKPNRVRRSRRWRRYRIVARDYKKFLIDFYELLFQRLDKNQMNAYLGVVVSDSELALHVKDHGPSGIVAIQLRSELLRENVDYLFDVNRKEKKLWTIFRTKNYLLNGPMTLVFSNSKISPENFLSEVENSFSPKEQSLWGFFRTKGGWVALDPLEIDFEILRKKDPSFGNNWKKYVMPLTFVNLGMIIFFLKFLTSRIGKNP